MLNFEPEKKINGEVYVPSLADIDPGMYGPATVFTSFIVEKVDNSIGIDSISRGYSWSEAPKTLDYQELLLWVKKNYPAGGEILEWMQEATVCNIMLERFEQDYMRNGSLLEVKSGDGYIPGVSISRDFKFVSQRGSEIAKNGNAIVITPHGRVKVPVPGKLDIIEKDFLGFAAVPVAYIVQFLGILLKFTKLTKNPSKAIGIPNFRGLVPSLYFVHSPRFPVPVNRVELVIGTNKSQNVILEFRNIKDYTKKCGSTKIKLDKGKGTYKITMNIYGIPYVPEMLVRLKPEDQTITVLKHWKILFP